MTGQNTTTSFFFLEAKIPLVKNYRQTSDGLKKESYPMVKHVSSHEELVTTPQDLYKHLNYHSRNNHCLLKGQLRQPLEFESRAGHTDPLQATQWMCLDFDYLDSPSQVDPLLSQMGLGDVSYVMQYGAGHKIDKPFSAHLFFLLSHEVLPEILKYWLMEQNFNCPDFERSLSLSRSNAALRWPLDISVAHNGIIIYIAPPQCEGLKDPLPPTERIRLVTKQKDRADLRAAFNNIDSAVIEERKNDKLKELRKKKGLKPKTFNTRMVSGVEVLSKPGTVAVTGQREARGFMYLNLNGGDSWGYYHPTDNPEILFNFKGEPNYLAREIVPEYYKSYKSLLRKLTTDTDLIYMAFLDVKSDTYFRGTFDPVSSTTNINPTGALQKLRDFQKQNGLWQDDAVPEWDYVFRFDDSRICVPEEQFLNRFQETEFLREARMAPTPKQFPPMIKRILMSVMGDDPQSVKRFLNWLAFIIQKRRRAETAWALTGVEGTGKGLLMHKVLTPIFGAAHVHTALMSSLGDSFNAFMQDCVLLFLDETDHRQLDETSKSMSKLKQAITDPTIPIHSKGKDHYQRKNYMSVIIGSNSRSAVAVSATDRRFNVAPYQNNRFRPTPAEVDSIQDELINFTTILYKWNVDEYMVRTPLVNKQRKLMQDLTTNSVDLILKALREGDLQHFADITPTANTPMDRSDGVDLVMRDGARRLMYEAQEGARRGEEQFLSRDEIHTLLKALSAESIPSTPAKFIQMLKHHGVMLDRNQGELGLFVTWQKPEHELKMEEPRHLRVVK